MGTDIHIYAEIKENGKWKKLDRELPANRDYDTFALLADVRNGTWGDELVPISPPRGLPEDTVIKNTENIDFDHPDYIWLGDHSFSYLYLDELFEVDKKMKIKKCALISPEVQKTYTRGIPDSYCVGTNCPDYKRVSWEEEVEDLYLFNKLLSALKDLKGKEVRVVFGFDS